MSRWRSAPELAEAVRLHERGETRAAHEAFEDAWRARVGTPLGEVARALAQWSAACVHLEHGRAAGFRSVGAKSVARLAAHDADFDTRALSARIARHVAAEPPPASRDVRDLGE